MWVIIFLPFWAVRVTPRCHGARLQMHALSNLAPFRAAHEFFSLAGGDGTPRKKGCILDPILQDTVGPNASAKSDQPPAWSPAVIMQKAKWNGALVEERPGGRVRSASLTFSLPSEGRA